MVTYYELLGVPPDADRERIWRGYLAAVRRELGADEAERRVQELDDAWETLRDPVRRSLYDRSLGRSSVAAEPQDPRTDLIELLGTLAETGRLPGQRLERSAGQPPDHPAPHARAADRPSRPRARVSPQSAERGRRPEARATPRAAVGPPATDRDRGAPTRKLPPLPPPPPPAGSRRPSVLRSPEPAPVPVQRAPEPSPAARSRRARGWLALVVLAWMLVGAVAGVALRGDAPQVLPLEEGACVELTDTTAVAVACGPSADGRIVEVTDDSAACAAQPQGYVALPRGGYGCVGDVG